MVSQWIHRERSPKTHPFSTRKAIVIYETEFDYDYAGTGILFNLTSDLSNQDYRDVAEGTFLIDSVITTLLDNKANNGGFDRDISQWDIDSNGELQPYSGKLRVRLRPNAKETEFLGTLRDSDILEPGAWTHVSFNAQTMGGPQNVLLRVGQKMVLVQLSQTQQRFAVHIPREQYSVKFYTNTPGAVVCAVEDR